MARRHLGVYKHVWLSINMSGDLIASTAIGNVHVFFFLLKAYDLQIGSD